MSAVKHIVASGECEKYSAGSICSYADISICMLIHINALGIYMVYFEYVMRQCCAVFIYMYIGV